MTHPSDTPHPQRWANVRFAVIGRLLAAPPGSGCLREELLQLAAKEWTHPSTGSPSASNESAV